MQEWVDDYTRINLHASLHGHVEQAWEAEWGEHGDEYELLPIHPWQYAYVLGLSEVQQYILDKKLIPMGSGGRRPTRPPRYAPFIFQS